MSPKEDDPNLDLIRAITDFEFNWNTTEDARLTGARQTARLGEDFSRPSAPSAKSGRWHEWKEWMDKFSNDLKDWRQRFEWLPELNRKGHEFARAFYYNPASRQFIEELNPLLGKQLVKRLTMHDAGMHVQRMLTIPADPDSRYGSFQGNVVFTDFAITFCRFLAEADETRRNKAFLAIPDSIDGDSARQFWTIAPYIFYGLREKEIDGLIAVEAVMDWGFAKSRPTYPSSAGENADYPGMKKLRIVRHGNEVGWYLTRNCNDQSHQLAKKVGAHIADQIAPIYQIQFFHKVV